MRGRDSISGRFAPVRREARASTTGTPVRDDATPVKRSASRKRARRRPICKCRLAL